MQQSEYQVAKRSLTYIVYRGQEEFAIQQELREWYQNTPTLHLSPTYYSMTMKEQFTCHQNQLKELIIFIRSKGGLQHFGQYIPHLGEVVNVQIQRIIQIQMTNLRILKHISQFKELLPQINNCQILISLLSDEQSLKYQTNHIDNIATLNEKLTSTFWKKGSFYQGWLTNYCLVTCQKQGKSCLALVKIRENGQLCNGIQEKWLGKSLGNYMNFSIFFENAQVEKFVELDQKSLNILDLWKSYSYYEDAQISLRGLLRLCDLAYRYCKMRKQFSTLEDSKEERPILEYQITTERITNAVSFAVLYYIGTVEGMRSYRMDLIAYKERCLLNQSFSDAFTAYVTEQSIKMAEQLRECMGGFGFLFYSGFPEVQQDLIWMAKHNSDHIDEKQDKYLKNIMNFEKNRFFILHYLGQVAVQDPEKMFKELGTLGQENISNPFHIFGYHASKITERLQNKELLTHPYTSYQMAQLTFELYVAQKFFNLIAFRRYRISNYILDRLLMHQNFQALKQMETNLELLQLFKKQDPLTMKELLSQLNVLMDSFEFGHFNVLVGIQNSQQFSEQLLDLSKNSNLRNTSSIVNEIRKPIVELVNRSRI